MELSRSAAPSNPDVSLYTAEPGNYLALQNRRPDYVRAVDSSVALAVRLLSGMTSPRLADFCCGTGSNTSRIAAELGYLESALLIDINPGFLQIASESPLGADNLRLVCSDILRTRMLDQVDLVLSVFAYHHIPDERKADYLRQARLCLRAGGDLLLTEIYSPDRETTSRYYSLLLDAVAPAGTNDTLYQFIKQTANSSNFEFKVARSFAHAQLQSFGFALQSSELVWPEASALGKDVGAFVEHWRVE